MSVINPQGPSLADILSGLKDVRTPAASTEDKTIQGYRSLPEDEKIQLVVQWKYQGVPASKIAKIFGVSARTISRWIEKNKNDFRESFEGETKADILTEHWQFLDHIEEVCMYEVGQLGRGRELDPKTGKIVDNSETKDVHLAKQRFISSAMQARKMKIDLHIQTGVLPTEVSRLYHTLEQEGRVDSVDSTPMQQRSREQLVEELLHKLESSPLDL